MTAPLDLEAIANEFLQQCGLHDAGISSTCACAERDYRPTMLALVREVERLRTELEQGDGWDQAARELDRKTATEPGA